jgi:hypothetical protein
MVFPPEYISTFTKEMRQVQDFYQHATTIALTTLGPLIIQFYYNPHVIRNKNTQSLFLR